MKTARALAILGNVLLAVSAFMWFRVFFTDDSESSDVPLLIGMAYSIVSLLSIYVLIRKPGRRLWWIALTINAAWFVLGLATAVRSSSRYLQGTILWLLISLVTSVAIACRHRSSRTVS